MILGVFIYFIIFCYKCMLRQFLMDNNSLSLLIFWNARQIQFSFAIDASSNSLLGISRVQILGIDPFEEDSYKLSDTNVLICIFGVCFLWKKSMSSRQLIHTANCKMYLKSLY